MIKRNKCPNCSEYMIRDDECNKCGWVEKAKSAQNNVRNPPPNILDTLVEEITRIGTHQFRGLPVASPADIARFWIVHNKPADEWTEMPKEVATLSKDGTRWVCPYHMRLVGTLRAFVLLNPSERRIVISGISEEKVWWRGDSVKHYLGVIDETHKMRAMGIDAYRELALEKMKNMLAEKIFIANNAST